MTREAELAWAAGLFEGEGCFYLRRPGKRSVHLGATLVMIDEDIVRRFGEIVGVGHFSSEKRKLQRPHHTPTWRWQANGEAVEHVFALIGDYLGERRRAKYAEIVAARRAYEVDRDARAHNFPQFAYVQDRLP